MSQGGPHPSMSMTTCTCGVVLILDALVTIGILSAEDGAYIRTNHIAYRGYDLRRVAEDVVVFECVFSNITTPQEIIAYSDGHVLTRGLRRTR